jgi:hypothetical protein
MRYNFKSKKTLTIVSLALFKLRISILFVHRVGTSPVLESRYSAALTANSSTYSLTVCGASRYFYEAIQVTVLENGCYSLKSNSSVNTIGFIYKDMFVPFAPREKLISKNDDRLNNGQYQLPIYLQTKTTYVLVVTTYSPNVTGTFSISASGPSNISLKRISEYLYYFVNNQHIRSKQRKYL